MGTNSKSFIRSILFVVGLFLTVSITNAQQISKSPPQEEEVVTVVNSPGSKAATSNVPVYRDYRGVKIGMTAEEVRAKLDRISLRFTQQK